MILGSISTQGAYVAAMPKPTAFGSGVPPLGSPSASAWLGSALGPGFWHPGVAIDENHVCARQPALTVTFW